ncbi:MAG: hypothetical protein NVV60_07205 [Luteimonas sp.]|nr:hypothetical protein [Luteimonas sp.]
MASGFFHGFQARFDASPLRSAFSPRKPRNALLRIAFGLVGIALLVVLLAIGLVVGATMLAFGMLRRLFGKRPAMQAVDGSVVDGEYRVVSKPGRAGQPILR